MPRPKNFEVWKSFRIRPEIYEKLKKKAAKQNTTTSQIIRDLVEKAVQKD